MAITLHLFRCFFFSYQHNVFCNPWYINIMIKLKTGEKMIRKIRKHWFVLVERIIILFFIFLAPFILYTVISGAELQLGIDRTITFDLNNALYVFLSAAWSLFIWMKCVAIWTDYYLDMWVITSKRLIDVEQFGFFHREVSTLRMEQIQDITVETRGIVATLLNFGNIHVQSAAESREFTIRGIPNPQKIKELIFKQHDRVIEKDSLIA